MTNAEYDAVIVGAGPGGYECALAVAKLGGKAAIIEKGELGGVCTNRGCIPTKALAASCDAYETVKRAAEFGVSSSAPQLLLPDVIKRRNRVSLTLRKGVEKLLQESKVDVYNGEGRLVSDTQVEVGGQIITGRNIVIATGSEPVGLPGIGIDHEFVISGDDAAASDSFPKRVVIVGGGFIGCEYASILGRLGADVTLVEALPRLLPLEDADTSSAVESALSKAARIFTNTRVEAVDKAAKTVTVAGTGIQTDTVIMAVGRKPIIPGGIDGLKIEYDKRGIKVDSRMRTNNPRIYAVGDVTCGLKLAHVAYAGAEVAAKNIMGIDCEADFGSVPWCVFTQPEIGRVGITEAEAKGPVKVGRADYLSNGKARCMGERGGFCKVIADGKSGTLLGVHIVGSHASDLVGEAAVALKKGLTAAELSEIIHPHPTLAELLRDACKNIN